ncbi:MAG: pyridoxamine 5'-phosphate oxidase [Bacteroidota bacterium]
MPNQTKDILSIRNDYQLKHLTKNHLKPDPIQQFNKWMKEVLTADISEPNAMILSTVGKTGTPSARVVLLREVNHEGFIFYSNYLSKKGNQIEHNNQVSLTFFWKEIERQVRIEGKANIIDIEKSDKYFASRPLDSQIGAIVSPQSSPIPSRQYLTELFSTFKKKNTDKTIQRPDHWGGYLVKPDMIEFWQGRPNRLHDRIAYYRKKDHWEMVRLAP